MLRISRSWPLLLICLTLVFFTSSCKTPDQFKAQADEEVYSLIDRTWTDDLGTKANFRISDVTPGPNDVVADEIPIEKGVLTLAEAVALATAQSRDYQDRKETLYSSALSLTGARHDFAQRWFSTLDGGYSQDSSDESVDASGDLGFSQFLEDGTAVGVSIAGDWLRYLTGDPRTSLTSVLSASITKPLLSGSSREIVRESLTQAERDLLYQVRSFNRYRKEFVVSIVSQYYRVLQSLDEVKNAESNYQSLIAAYDEAQLSAQAGRRSRLQADQTKQNMLQARDTLTRTQRSYQESLDRFKLTLAIPINVSIELDKNELDVLSEMQFAEPDFSVDNSVETALAGRLDLATTKDKVDDAHRKVAVAEDALRAGLDLVAGLDASSPSGKTQIDNIMFQNGTYTAGLSLDLPLDKKIQRNTYRSKLIALNQAQRDYEEAVDNTKLDVRNAYRSLEESARRYSIQKDSLKLAEERVNSTNMLLKAGRASSRDLLEAQASLLSAQNDTTSTMVDYMVAKLSFYRDIGVLTVRPDGLWEQNIDGP